ncbi:MAG: AMP-dependent synthetase/ligase [Spirochaetota bacterium]
MSSIPKLLQQIQKQYPDTEATLSKDARGRYMPTTYSQLYQEVLCFAAGLRELGVERKDHVGLISDNRKEWLITDLSLLSLGAIDVPRGRDAMPQELAYILSFAGCRTCMVENAEQLEKVAALHEKLPELKDIVILDQQYEKQQKTTYGIRLHTFSEVFDSGSAIIKEEGDSQILQEIEAGSADDTATIIFTSGTTGEPKGVMLSHTNFLFQLEQVKKVVDIEPGDRWLSVLPVWHSFERVLQYVALGTASTIAYSKPIGKILLQDLQQVEPSWMGSVPRIWETVKDGVYKNVKKKKAVARALFRFFVWVGSSHAWASNMVKNLMPQFKRRWYPLDILIGFIPWLLLAPFNALGSVLVFKAIKSKFGKRFKAGVSGGGSLPKSVDVFFKAIGITLLDGYGLTETAPVIGIRPMRRQVPKTVAPLPETEIKIVTEQGTEAKPGHKGVIYARGPQVMQGYYRREDLTKQIIDDQGWLNTGDLGMWTYTGEYAVCGRAKDTIVLSGGENIEPVPIEAKLRESEFIEQAIVLGQDKKYLAALIVPDTKQIELYMKNSGILYTSRSDLLEMPETVELINSEVNDLISTKNGFKVFEHIVRFKLIRAQFQVGKELSAKQEIKRHVINEQYKREITELFR